MARGSKGGSRSRHELLQSVHVQLPTSHQIHMRHRRSQLELDLPDASPNNVQNQKTRMHTHLQELVRLPRPRRQILQRDVDRRDRLALDQFLLVALEDPERDAKEDVEPVHEKDVPDSKERLCWRVVRMSILVGMAGNVPRSGDSP